MFLGSSICVVCFFKHEDYLFSILHVFLSTVLCMNLPENDPEQGTKRLAEIKYIHMLILSYEIS
jgi:hypothetical protein